MSCYSLLQPAPACSHLDLALWVCGHMQPLIVAGGPALLPVALQLHLSAPAMHGLGKGGEGGGCHEQAGGSVQDAECVVRR